MVVTQHTSKVALAQEVHNKNIFKVQGCGVFELPLSCLIKPWHNCQMSLTALSKLRLYNRTKQQVKDVEYVALKDVQQMLEGLDAHLRYEEIKSLLSGANVVKGPTNSMTKFQTGLDEVAAMNEPSNASASPHCEVQQEEFIQILIFASLVVCVFDREGGGEIKAGDLCLTMSHMTRRYSEGEISQKLQERGIDRSDAINYSEFISILHMMRWVRICSNIVIGP